MLKATKFKNKQKLSSYDNKLKTKSSGFIKLNKKNSQY